LAATWLIWGSTYLAIRFALAGFAPYFLMATRFVCAGALLIGWQMARGAVLPNATEWRNALLVGTLMLGGGMGGGGMGPMIWFVAGGLHLPAALPFVIPLWLATTLVTARTAYHYSTKRRAQTLEKLADRLEALARELVPARPAVRGLGRPP